MVETCLAMKVQPPSANNRTEFEKARNRLRGFSGQGPFDLIRHICSMAHADLVWLGTQPVLGAGSVVMHGTEIKLPAVLSRPEVRHTYDMATKTLGRELGYMTAKGSDLAASTITDVLVRTKWPMGQMPETFEYDGPTSPYYLAGPAMKQQAEKWGIKVDANTTPRKLQQLVVARAVVEYERQYKAVVDAAWHGAGATARPAEGQKKAAANPAEVGEADSGATGQAAAVDEDGPAGAVAKDGAGPAGADPTSADGAGRAEATEAETSAAA